MNFDFLPCVLGKGVVHNFSVNTFLADVSLELTILLVVVGDVRLNEALKLHEGVVSLVLEEITFLFGRRLNFCRQFDVSSKNWELRYLRLIWINFIKIARKILDNWLHLIILSGFQGFDVIIEVFLARCVRALSLIPQIADSLLPGMAFHDAQLLTLSWWTVPALGLLHLYIFLSWFPAILNRLRKPCIFFSYEQVLPLRPGLRLENNGRRFYLRPVVEAKEHILFELFVLLWLVSFDDDLERLHISALVLFQISLHS